MTTPPPTPAETLLPCPFCGLIARLSIDSCSNITCIACNDSVCGTGPIKSTQADAISAWNTRPLEQQLAAKVLGLEETVRACSVAMECLGENNRELTQTLGVLGAVGNESPTQAAARVVKERDELRAELAKAKDWIDSINQSARELVLERSDLRQERDELQAKLAEQQEFHAWEISPAMAQAKIDTLTAERDELRSQIAAMTPPEQSNQAPPHHPMFSPNHLP